MNSFFETYPGYKSAAKLTASASARVYWRLTLEEGSCPASVIGVEGTDAAENGSFIAMSAFFASRGVNVPRVLAVSEDGMCYIQEDLGDDVLRNHLDDRELLKQTLSDLVHMQHVGADFDYEKCWATKEFCPRVVNFDLNYFKYCFLKVYGAQFNEYALQDDFELLCQDLCSVPSDTFLYRDFQSRNIMVRYARPYFIDFQGGFKGPFYYDLCSFVFQASAGFSEALRNELIDAYYDSLSGYRKVDRKEFDSRVQMFALFRCLQALGAYGFRGLTERKQYFIDSIPAGLRNFRLLMEGGNGDRYPYLKKLAYELDSYSI